METCKSCIFFVSEDEYMNWTHEKAVQEESGFCLMKDLFTETISDKVACDMYSSDDTSK